MGTKATRGNKDRSEERYVSIVGVVLGRRRCFPSQRCADSHRHATRGEGGLHCYNVIIYVPQYHLVRLGAQLAVHMGSAKKNSAVLGHALSREMQYFLENP